MDILAAFAHPDDETRFLGGTLAMLAAKGARVHILIATRGEGGEVGDATIYHRTQHALFIRQASKAASRQMSLAEVTSNEESLHRACLSSKTNCDDPLAYFLRSYCAEALIEK